MQETIEPIHNITNILKLAIHDNMNGTKDDFKNLSETHDEAKLLVDSMAENYRSLKVSKCMRYMTRI